MVNGETTVSAVSADGPTARGTQGRARPSALEERSRVREEAVPLKEIDTPDWARTKLSRTATSPAATVADVEPSDRPSSSRAPRQISSSVTVRLPFRGSAWSGTGSHAAGTVPGLRVARDRIVSSTAARGSAAPAARDAADTRRSRHSTLCPTLQATPALTASPSQSAMA